MSRLRARQILANDIVNEDDGRRPSGERRPELSAEYETRFRETRSAIVESAPYASDWDEIAEEQRQSARRYEPTAGDTAADEDARRALSALGAEAPR